MCDLWALYHRREAGFSIHEMVPAIDAGKILTRVVVSDGSDRHYPRYLRESARREVGALRDVLRRIATEGRVTGQPNVAPEGLQHFKTPSRNQVGQFRREGLRL
jgi:methionyl-tRNA formyltransferase